MTNPTGAQVGTSNSETLVDFGVSSYFLGMDGDDKIYTNAGDDIAYGGNGSDVIYAGNGNDSYYGGNDAGDVISFEYSLINGLLAGMIRTVNVSAIVFDLAKPGLQNVGGAFGLDFYQGFTGVSGGGGNDTLYGNGVGNILYGDKGNDLIDGRGGSDNIYAGEGADKLTGGAGGDRIFLGGQFHTTTNDNPSSPVDEVDRVRDTVYYKSTSDSFGTFNSSSTNTVDVVFNFDGGGLATDDKIDLSAIDAQPLVAGNQNFHFVSQLTATGVGEVAVRKWALATGVWEVLVDTDKDSSAEMTILVTSFDNIKLHASDFVL